MAGKVTVPDFTEAIIGYRLWRLKYVTTAKAQRDWGWRLLSPVQGEGSSVEWKPGKALRATCRRPWNSNNRRRRNERRHRAPDLKCRCGIYAGKSPDPSLLMLFPMLDLMVVGEVALWGRVLVCERGWRAEYAYPKRLWLFAPPWRGDGFDDHRLPEMYDQLHDYRVPVGFSELVMDFRPVPSPVVQQEAG